MKLFETLAVISTAEASMPYFSKCKALKLQEAGINIPEAHIIDDGEDCALTRNKRSDDYDKPKLWTKNWDPSENKYIVPYYFEEGYEHKHDEEDGEEFFGDEAIDHITNDAKYFRQNTCIKLVEIHDRDEIENWESRIRIEHAHDCGASPGRSKGDVEMYMALSCSYGKATIVHEFMHNLGFEHEFQRPGRSQWIGLHSDLDITDADYYEIREDAWNGDISQPYDFKSAMNYQVWEMDDDKPNFHMAGDEDEPAPFERTWSRGSMSDGDIHNINYAYECDVNDKCTDEGENPCGEGEHECLNQPRGFNCECEDGFILYDLAHNKQRCAANFCANAPEDRCGGQEHDCINDVNGLKCGCKNGLVEMYDEDNQVMTCDTDWCAEAGTDVCGGVPSECLNLHSAQDYRCIHCPPGYTFSEDNKCIDVNECLTENVCGAVDEDENALQCVNTPKGYKCLACPFCTTQSRTFEQQIAMINEVIHIKLFTLIRDNKPNRKWKTNLTSKISQLEEATNEEKSRCNPPFIPTTLFLGGATNCELVESISAALIETANEWICNKKQSRKFKKQFHKLLKKFYKKNC